ncbi:hypothetical protein L9F63_019552 [Diploptera punctata]|uniref:Gamma-interferon-inducible lysosomal thiol reductase n=1 Tax=Diploptera punctata TaxID=6984 RepID=A0AAD8EDU5_DIPPU|nr:hypothetical protein L9F63_019552 [Diploptera punctata]
MAVSYVLRFKIFAFIIVCFILWQTFRHFPFQDDTEQELLLHKEVIEPSQAVNSVITPILVSVFYEALCPDSRSFFTKHLLPTYEKIPHLIKVDLIPYGKAKTESVGDGYTFSCQHGPVECKANKIHACAITKIPEPDVRLRYTTCMISDNMNPLEIGQQCAQEHNVRWEQIAECAVSAEGDNLLKLHGDKTNSLHPRISFVPTILLDKKFESQPAVLKNLFKEVCKKVISQTSQLVPECS